MSKDLNDINVIGRLTRDPELKYTASGVAVTKFSIANNYSYKQGENLVQDVNYFDVTVWNQQAVNCEKYLKKGSQVAVSGCLRQNRWTDQASGTARSKIEILGNVIQFLGSSQTPSVDGSTQNVGDSQFVDEGIPF